MSLKISFESFILSFADVSLFSLSQMEQIERFLESITRQDKNFFCIIAVKTTLMPNCISRRRKTQFCRFDVAISNLKTSRFLPPVSLFILIAFSSI
jgi:hypothetical protein